jgi:hypothetical protein
MLIERLGDTFAEEFLRVMQTRTFRLWYCARTGVFAIDGWVFSFSRENGSELEVLQDLSISLRSRHRLQTTRRPRAASLT